VLRHSHHAHGVASYDGILSDLDRAFIGMGTNAGIAVRPPAPPAGQPPVQDLPKGAITRVGALPLFWRRTGSPLAVLGFLPRSVHLGIEFDPSRLGQTALDVVLTFQDPQQHPQEVTVRVPLAQSLAVSADPAPGPRPTWADFRSRLAGVLFSSPAGAQAEPPGLRFRLPWHRTPAGDRTPVGDEERAALARRIEQVRQAEARRQATDEQLLRAGDIPSRARQRLAGMRDAAADRACFSSDLSPAEAALLRRTGSLPLGLIRGSAMYHVGVAYASTHSDCEVTVLSDAYNEATRLAASRLGQEAAMLDAHGVIGVRFEMVRREWAEKSIEVQLTGTAIAGPGAASGDPWLSDLSGQEWWVLHRAGYDPVGLVYGHCTWFVLTTENEEWIERSSTNQEIPHWGEALAQCRDRADGRMRHMAHQLHADGVVGVHLSRRLDEIRLTGRSEDDASRREHRNLVLSILGTAIRLRAGIPLPPAIPLQVLSLRDGRLTPLRALPLAEARFE